MADNIKEYEKENKKSKCMVREWTDEEKNKYNIKERKVMSKTLKFDEELRDLLPPLTEDEFKKLEERILKDGCQTPLFTWQGYIADGHNRYAICTKHNIEFESIELGYKDKSEVMHWMIDTQLGRRNLSLIQRITVAEKYRGKLKEEAEVRKSLNGGDKKSEVSERSPAVIEKKKTSKELAKLAEVGSGTMARYEYVMNNGDEDLKKKMLNDEIPITAAYDTLKQKQIKPESKPPIVEPLPQTEVKQEPKQESIPEFMPKPIVKLEPATRKCKKCKQDKSLPDFTNNIDFCNDCWEHINDPVWDRDFTEGIDDSTEAGRILKEMKTPKVAADYIIVKEELISIKEDIQDVIKIAYECIFERYDLPSKMTQEDKDDAIRYMDQLSEEILELKNKIKKIQIKGEK